jgi:hypothetical protein
MARHLLKYLFCLSAFLILSQEKMVADIQANLGPTGEATAQISAADVSAISSSSLEYAPPTKPSTLGRAGRIHQSSPPVERAFIPASNQRIVAAPEDLHAAGKNLPYSYLDALFCFLQSLLYPNHSFW